MRLNDRFVILAAACLTSAGGACAQSIVNGPARLDESILPLIGGGAFGTNLNNAQFYPSYTAAFTDQYLNQNAWFFRIEGSGDPLYNGLWPIGSISLPNTFVAGPGAGQGTYYFPSNGTFSGRFDARLAVTVTSLGIGTNGLPAARLSQTLTITNTGIDPFMIDLFAVQSLPLQGVSNNTTWIASDFNPSTGRASRFLVTQSGGPAFADVLAQLPDRWQLGRNASVDPLGISTLFAPTDGNGTPGNPFLDLSNKSLVTNGPTQGPQALGGSVAVQWRRFIPAGRSLSVTIQTGFNAAVPPACPGDLNNDGLVNTADLAQLLAGFGSTVIPGTGADISGDGRVNTNDLALLLGNFGGSCF